MKKRQFIAAMGAALMTTGMVQAQTAFPAQQAVKWVVPYAPGGTTDVIARNLAIGMSKELGQTVVVENKPGAATIIGATQIVRSPADGYTVGTADSGTLAFNPAMYRSLSYDAQKDFSFIGGLGRMPLVLAVHPDFPAKNMREFLAHVRSHPGEVTSGSSGPGSPLHVALELFKQRTGSKLLHVPYKGSAPALQDLMAGQVQTMFVDLPPSLSMIKGGKLRVLAVATPQRMAILPDVPTMAEAGVPGFEAYAWQGFVGPAKLPAPVVQRLNKDLNAALAQPALRAKFEEIGIQPMAMTPREFGDFVRSEQKLWSEVIRSAKIQLD
jgi:tripartite-type tricarboxylate transporter receptor subunit TctC